MLTAYDGVSITYDTMGNPLTDGTWTYTWEHGRQLASMTDGTTTWTYTYDANELRSKRTNGTDTYTYVYNGSKLVQMTKGTHTLYFTYDASGNPSTVTLNGATYYYITNLQGDVIEIRSSSGGLVCYYAYDAWGKVISRSYSSNHLIDDLNPLLYRGYVYDTDTGLYYLQSRYYDPQIGRFLNADALVSTGQGQLGYNMFAYCNNNPISFADPGGNSCRLVGAGIQFEIDVGGAVFGIEIIVYWDVAECFNGGLTVAVYAYGGASMPVNDPLLASIIATVTDNSTLLTNGTEEGVLAVAAMIGEGFSINVSGVMVFGYDNFTKTESYTASFTSIGGGIGRIKGSYAYADSCFAVSVGYDIAGISSPSVGINPSISKTYYWQVCEFTIGGRSQTNRSSAYGRSRRRGGGNGALCCVICLA